MPRFQKAAKTWQGAKGLESLKGGPEKPLSNTGRRNSKLQWRPRDIGDAHGKLHTEWRQSKRGAEFRWEELEERTTQGS